MTLSKPISNPSIYPQPLRYERRAQLPLKVDSFWQIQSGAVRTYTWLEDGTVVTLGIWGQGDVVSHILCTASPYKIECLTEVEVVALPLNTYPHINEALIRHVQQLQEFIQILRSRTIDIGLVGLFTWLAKKFGREVESGKLIELRLTHQEIAEILGTTRVTVTRSMKKFEQEGIIERSSRKLIILPQHTSAWYYEI